MNALPIIIGVLCCLAIAYRYYSAFIAAKVMCLDDSRITPAIAINDGQNYHPTPKWVLFGHHFAAITGAGPLIGPVLAAQFGFLPGLLWIVVGVCLAGAVQDFVILSASVRRGGRSLAEIARSEIGPVAGLTTAFAILFIVVIALAGLGLAVVNALKDSPWGVFTIGVTIPVALIMGAWMKRGGGAATVAATVFGVTCLLGAVIAGAFIPGTAIASWFTFSKDGITYLIAAYGFLASVLPVWLLLAPRDYLSTFMKIGTIAVLIGGVILVHPELKMPAVSQFAAGGGPIIPGKLFPFVFITIACGAISGFHALVGSGTTPKMIMKESHCRAIGYGAMLMEGVVGVVSLIAASSLYPGDYFAINVPPEKFATLGMTTVHLPQLAQAVGENVAGRTGGAVSLALGMAQIFSGIPGMSGLMSYWYHFAIMFEALFILTTIDAGTRVARFILQELAGRVWKPMARTDWMPGTILSSAAIVAAWAWFILNGSIASIWPMFGISNQLLAATALAIGTTVIINSGRARYAWVTGLPLAFVATTTLTAGWRSIFDNFLPLAREGGQPFLGYLNATLASVMMGCVGVILFDAMRKWRSVLRRASPDSGSGARTAGD